MMIFYVLTIIDLVGRLAIMISLNYRSFFAMENLVISVVCLELALMVGTSNAFILTSLTIDLRTLKCQTEEEMTKVTKLRSAYSISLYVWTGLVFTSAVLFFFIANYEYIMLMESIMFTLQAAGLIFINVQLHRTLSGIFKI